MINPYARGQHSGEATEEPVSKTCLIFEWGYVFPLDHELNGYCRCLVWAAKFKGGASFKGYHLVSAAPRWQSCHLALVKALFCSPMQPISRFPIFRKRWHD